MDAHEASQLMLEWRDQQQLLTGERAITLGSDVDTDLTLEGEYTSRRHARIEARNQYFVLVDHSTNGTYIQTEDEQITFVRRGEMRLWGAGWISLGEPLNQNIAIRFHHL